MVDNLLCQRCCAICQAVQLPEYVLISCHRQSGNVWPAKASSTLLPDSIQCSARQLTYSHDRGIPLRLCQTRSGSGGTACAALCLRRGPHACPLRTHTSLDGLCWLWALVQVGPLRLVIVSRPAGFAADTQAISCCSSLYAEGGWSANCALGIVSSQAALAHRSLCSP